MKSASQRDSTDSGDPKPDRRSTEDTAVARDTDELAKEVGGRKGPDPSRYGDWEKNGRCIDF